MKRFLKWLKIVSLLIIISLGLHIVVQGYTWKDVTALTNALYFEGAVNESPSGLWAIASNIRNRSQNPHFPHTIAAVVADGSHGRHNGGCQYSFMCDGLPEDPRVFETIPARKAEMERFWGPMPYETRYRLYQIMAITFLAMGPAYDPTNGSTHYWTGPRPYWFSDCLHPIIRVGNHNFCKSK